MSNNSNNQSFNELKNILRDQLQAKGIAGARMQGRTGELPFERPVSEYQNGDTAFLRDLSRAAVQLVEEVPQRGWTADTLEWLVCFIERTQIRDAVDALETVVRRENWLKTVDDGPRAHMLALRTLRSLWWKADPNFWGRLPAEFQKRYPALVFGGLADHNLDLAFANLPRLAVNTTAARDISLLFASLVETKGMDRIWEKLQAVRGSLCDDVVELFENWFFTRNYVLQTDDGWAASSHDGQLLESFMVKPLAHLGAPA